MEDIQERAHALKDELLEGLVQVFVEVECASLKESLLHLFQLAKLLLLLEVLRLVLLCSNKVHGLMNQVSEEGN